jgi:hypothetical protein
MYLKVAVSTVHDQPDERTHASLNTTAWSQAARPHLSWQQRCMCARTQRALTLCHTAACVLPGSSCNRSPASVEATTADIQKHFGATGGRYGSMLAQWQPQAAAWHSGHTCSCSRHIHKVMPAAACYNRSTSTCGCKRTGIEPTHVVSSGEKLPCSCLRRSWCGP